MYVHQISINPDVKNCGYGKRLMEAVERMAADQQCAYVELDYWIENEEARRFYMNIGFEVDRECVRKKL
ncbi:GNAT family N-acetyltransferase [Halobacillus yeomjeoni]|uniref:GNAT family N-acetyltransferase n=1 Tax=Halobacillus yeomjeoni TaxID=311194 RepID=A0A931HVI5_9BACI|nr:GNAT family N-acetyltransferase [Halobacillus yeomjeoni]